MKTFLFVALTVFAVTLVGCKKETTPPTACERLEDLTASVLASVCTEDASCVWCECATQGLELVATVDGSDLVYSCGAAVSCDATAAEACFASEATCSASAFEAAGTACASSVPAL